MGPEGPTIAKFISDFLKKELDNFLHKNLETAEVMLKKIQDSERERKAMAGVTKLARERAKKVNLHNSKLRDCRVHLNDTRGDEERKLASSISSPRATPPQAPLPRSAMWRPRPCSRCAASRSTLSA